MGGIVPRGDISIFKWNYSEHETKGNIIGKKHDVKQTCLTIRSMRLNSRVVRRHDDGHDQRDTGSEQFCFVLRSPGWNPTGSIYFPATRVWIIWPERRVMHIHNERIQTAGGMIGRWGVSELLFHNTSHLAFRQNNILSVNCLSGKRAGLRQRYDAFVLLTGNKICLKTR